MFAEATTPDHSMPIARKIKYYKVGNEETFAWNGNKTRALIAPTPMIDGRRRPFFFFLLLFFNATEQKADISINSLSVSIAFKLRFPLTSRTEPYTRTNHE